MPTPQSTVQVSVIMVTYKTGPVLWDAIESVLAQNVSLELVLVNNGNPSDVLEKLALFERDQPRLRLITGQGNVGFSKGCNLGAAQTTGKYLMFLNPDCILFPDCIESLLETIAGLPSGSLVGGNLLNSDNESCVNTRREFPTPWRLVVESLYLYKLAPNHPYFERLKDVIDASSDTPVQTSVVSGALMMVKRDMFEFLEGFDEDYFLHVEDVDYCMRHHLSKHDTFFCPKAKAYHFQSSSDVSWFSVEFHKAQSFLIYFQKHFSDSYPSFFMNLLRFVLYGRFAARSILKFFSFGKLPATSSYSRRFVKS